jgi:predicted nucleic acid-binding protein
MVLVDNNILSALAKIEQLDLLADLFNPVRTPSSVVDELNRAEAAGYSFVDRIDDVKAYDSGWLHIVTPTDTERRVADDIQDHALSTTDAHCIAIAANRGWRLLTDDAHVGTIADQRDVSVWDLPLFFQAAIRYDYIETDEDLSRILASLRTKDGYRFAESDLETLYNEF